MMFGRVSPTQAKGLILAHSLRAGPISLKKGTVLTTKDVQALLDADIDQVTVASLAADDISEENAANQIGAALVGPNISLSQPVAGRVNLVSAADGIFTLSPEKIAAMNAIDEAVTIATLHNYTRVRKGALLATIKIIPYGVARPLVDQVIKLVSHDTLALAPFKPKSFDLILTKTDGFKDSLLVKGRKVVQTRVAPLGFTMKSCITVDHCEQAVTKALIDSSADMTFILGASATSDRLDIIPAALVASGGNVIRYGMPVDPGNLLVLGQRGDQVVIGLPGCARSPALNGIDWVLERLAVGVSLTNEDIAQMGVGGLLKEIPDRILPRSQSLQTRDHVCAVLLAAGASHRMAGDDKLLRTVDGIPLLRRSVQNLLASNVDDCIVVLAPHATAHREALLGLQVTIVEVFDADQGMSASIRAGISSLAAKTSAVVLALADMPDITPDHINQIVCAQDREAEQLIICPVDKMGQRGHPVLFDARFFESLMGLSGDRGARDVVSAVPEFVHEIPMDTAVTLDLDTPEAWDEWEKGGRV
jgi:molybdenum cofactor cytidylyltransferase